MVFEDIEGIVGCWVIEVVFIFVVDKVGLFVDDVIVCVD